MGGIQNVFFSPATMGHGGCQPPVVSFPATIVYTISPLHISHARCQYPLDPLKYWNQLLDWPLGQLEWHARFVISTHIKKLAIRIIFPEIAPLLSTNVFTRCYENAIITTGDCRRLQTAWAHIKRKYARRLEIKSLEWLMPNQGSVGKANKLGEHLTPIDYRK